MCKYTSRYILLYDATKVVCGATYTFHDFFYVCLFNRSLRAETHLGHDGTRLKQNAQVRLKSLYFILVGILEIDIVLLWNKCKIASISEYNCRNTHTLKPWSSTRKKVNYSIFQLFQLLIWDSKIKHQFNFRKHNDICHDYYKKTWLNTCFHNFYHLTYNTGADPRMVRIGTGPPFWQINHANSAYFRLFWGYFRVISATRPPPFYISWIRPWYNKE